VRVPRFRGAAREEPQPPQLGYAELETLVVEHFGSKLSHVVTDPDAQTIEGVLYGAVAFSCAIDPENGTFGGGIRLANGWMMTTLLGEKISLASDAASVERSLATIERYCLHRLPDEFLDAFDAAMP
jgi:hypothetical protein